MSIAFTPPVTAAGGYGASNVTPMSIQPKCFQAQGYYWIFFLDNFGIPAYVSSADGLTWSANTYFGALASSSLGTDISIWYDETNNNIFLVRVIDSDPNNFYYSIGQPDGTGNITWISTVDTAVAVTNPGAVANPTIFGTTTSDIWVGLYTQNAFLETWRFDGGWTNVETDGTETLPITPFALAVRTTSGIMLFEWFNTGGTDLINVFTSIDNGSTWTLQFTNVDGGFLDINNVSWSISGDTIFFGVPTSNNAMHYAYYTFGWLLQAETESPPNLLATNQRFAITNDGTDVWMLTTDFSSRVWATEISGIVATPASPLYRGPEEITNSEAIPTPIWSDYLIRNKKLIVSWLAGNNIRATVIDFTNSPDAFVAFLDTGVGFDSVMVTEGGIIIPVLDYGYGEDEVSVTRIYPSPPDDGVGV